MSCSSDPGEYHKDLDIIGEMCELHILDIRSTTVTLRFAVNIDLDNWDNSNFDNLGLNIQNRVKGDSEWDYYVVNSVMSEIMLLGEIFNHGYYGFEVKRSLDLYVVTIPIVELEPNTTYQFRYTIVEFESDLYIHRTRNIITDCCPIIYEDEWSDMTEFTTQDRVHTNFENISE